MCAGKRKYSERLYDAFMNSLCALRLAVVMSKQFICVHGGISAELRRLDGIQNVRISYCTDNCRSDLTSLPLKLGRFREPPTSGLMCDILLSDPVEDFGQEKGSENFVDNDMRGRSYIFTHMAACTFLERNRLLSIIRSHRAQNAVYRCSYPPGASSQVCIQLSHVPENSRVWLPSRDDSRCVDEHMFTRTHGETRTRSP
jgi:serine/threonine-protein phosphatase 2B catalytic subunit